MTDPYQFPGRGTPSIDETLTVSGLYTLGKDSPHEAVVHVLKKLGELVRGEDRDRLFALRVQALRELEPLGVPVRVLDDALGLPAAPHVASKCRGNLPPPLGVRDLLSVEDPVEEWLVEGLIPASANVLMAGYPKTFKTLTVLELAVALATGTPFLGRYRVPTPKRSGIVLMEDQEHRVRRRLQRLCLGRGVALADLDGFLQFWFRPPLRLADHTVTDLAEYAERFDLDLLWVDSWSYVATGDSNSSDEVTPQLQTYSLARLRRPGLSVGLTHHARKTVGDGRGERLTDTIRNSGAFGAWYDAGLVLTRRDEASPVTLRAELRDFASPEPFAFTVEDERPASVLNAGRSDGWLRLRACDVTPQKREPPAAGERLVPMVREFLKGHPEGVSRTGLRDGVKGTHANVEAAFELLERAGEAVYTPSPGKGRPSSYRLISPHPAEPCRDPAPAGSKEDPAEPAAHAPVGGGAGRRGSEAVRQGRPAGPISAGSCLEDPLSVIEEDVEVER